MKAGCGKEYRFRNVISHFLSLDFFLRHLLLQLILDLFLQIIGVMVSDHVCLHQLSPEPGLELRGLFFSHSSSQLAGSDPVVKLPRNQDVYNSGV